MKKIYLVLIAFGILAVLAFVIFSVHSPEDSLAKDSWVKDSRGVWVEQGNSSKIPSYVVDQQEAIVGALELYFRNSSQGINFSSQCLGTARGYAVDIVHVPRTSEDDLPQNQCLDYLNGKVNHFIELDKNGKVVRVG